MVRNRREIGPMVQSLIVVTKWPYPDNWSQTGEIEVIRS